MTQTIQLHVTGMTCGGCENAVKRAVGQIDGVEEVTASHTAASVGVRYDGDKVAPDTIRQKIEKLGYQVVS
jgi:copper chaperone